MGVQTMRDITITRRVFTLDELSPTAQDRAYGLLHADAWDQIDNQMVSEYLAGKFAYMANGDHADDGYYGGGLNKDQLKDRYGVNIYWSVSYSQGDGASIDGVISRDNHPNFNWPNGIHTIRVKTSNQGNSIITDIYGVDEDGGEGKPRISGSRVRSWRKKQTSCELPLPRPTALRNPTPCAATASNSPPATCKTLSNVYPFVNSCS